MATQTTNLGLIKPAGTDYVLVSDFNTNADTLDTAIGDLDALQTTEKGSLVGAINDAMDSASATVNVGTTTTGNAGTNASVTNVGTDKDAVFNFAIPRGDPGVSVTVGTTTTGAAGSSASVSNSGTASDPILDFTVPQGANGQGVPTGGAIGQALVKSGTPDYATGWAAVGRSNPTLLHNGDWRTPIHNHNVYVIDRWISTGTVTRVDGSYVTLASGATMTQRMEIIPAKLYGAAYTVSVDIGGVIQVAALTFPSSGAGAAVSQALNGVTVEIGFVDLGTNTANWSSLEGISSQYIPYVKFTATEAVGVSRVKLELGNVSTLANDKCTDFPAESRICEWYYRTVQVWAYCYYAGYIQPIYFPMMRTKPSLVGNGTLSKVQNSGATVEYPITDVPLSAISATYVAATGVVAGTFYRVTLVLSADL